MEAGIAEKIPGAIGGEDLAGGDRRKAWLIVALIGGILTTVGVFLPWLVIGARFSHSGWEIGAFGGFVHSYVILAGGILVIVGSLLALLEVRRFGEAYEISVPKSKALDYLLPIGGIVVAVAAWGLSFFTLLGGGSFTYQLYDYYWYSRELAYGSYLCLIGSVFPLIGYLKGARKPERLREWGNMQGNLGKAVFLISLPVLALALFGGTILVSFFFFLFPCWVIAGMIASRGSSARDRGEREEIEAEVHRALKSKKEVTLEEIASKTGVEFSKVRRRIKRMIRKDRLPGVYLEAGILTKGSGAPSRAKEVSEFKPAQIERMVYGYIVDRGGEIDVEECAEELGIPKTNVEMAIEVLKAKGKLKI